MSQETEGGLKSHKSAPQMQPPKEDVPPVPRSASVDQARHEASDALPYALEDPNCPQTTPRGTPAIDIKCGPLLRFLGYRDSEANLWRGTVLIVTNDATSNSEAAPELTLEFGGGGSSSTIKAQRIHHDFLYSFWRFSIEIPLKKVAQTVAYCINGDTERSYAFHVPSLSQTMNIMFYSCNGFSLAVDATKFKGQLWSDVLESHKKNPFHVMLGGGDQLYCDAVKFTVPQVIEWAEEKNPLKKHSFTVTAEAQQGLDKFYLNQYIAWFGLGFWVGKVSHTVQASMPLAMASIPMINIFDDHDIIDGFGSYPDRTMRMPMFEAIGNTAFKYYMLFQHHTSPDESITDRSWVPGPKVGPFIHQKSRSIYARLGQSVGFYGLDCRTERSYHRVVENSSYEAMFSRLAQEVKQSNGEIKHLLIMLGVPIAYPRLVWLETLLSSRMLAPVRVLAKHGVLSGLTNEFDGRIEILDDLDDHWCARHHKKERNQFVQRLLDFARRYSVRLTVLAGDVHLAGIGRFYSKNSSIDPSKDSNLMLNVISSAIVNTPPPDKMADFLNKRNKIHHFSRNVNEDLVPIFTHDVDGSSRNNKHLLPRRNWCSITLRGQDASNAELHPGPINANFGSNGNGTASSNGNHKNGKDDVAYADMPGALSVVLHMEKDRASTANETIDYQVMVPPLQLAGAPNGSALERTASVATRRSAYSRVGVLSQPTSRPQSPPPSVPANLDVADPTNAHPGQVPPEHAKAQPEPKPVAAN